MRTNKEHFEFVADVIAGIRAMQLRAFNERVAVIRDPAAEKIGSLFVPEEGKRREPSGTVVAVGSKVSPDEDLIPGDRVMYTKYAPIHFTIVLPDGRKADLELLHVSDLYLGWPRGASDVAI